MINTILERHFGRKPSREIEGLFCRTVSPKSSPYKTPSEGILLSLCFVKQAHVIAINCVTREDDGNELAVTAVNQREYL